MQDRTHESGAFRVGDLIVDTGRHAVFRGSDELDLPKKSFDLLLTLIDAAPDVVTFDDLIERAWPGSVVLPETVTQRVMLLRRALGDSADQPVYVRGVRGVGYALVPAVRPGPAGPLARQSSPATARAARKVAAAEQPIGLTAAESDDTRLETASDLDLTLPAKPSVAVLPLQIIGSDPALKTFGYGFSHDMTTRIAQTRSLFVIARGSSFRFGLRTRGAREIGRALGVRYLVDGSVQISGGKLRVNVSLTEAESREELWAEQFTRPMDDHFALQDEIATSIAATVEAQIEAAERHRAAYIEIGNLDAWSAYHRGCWHMYHFKPKHYAMAEECFRKAIRLDPGAQRPHAGLSFIHWQQAFLELTDNRDREIGQALASAERAIEIDARDPLGHWSLGRARILARDEEHAVDDLQRSIELSPSFAHGHYSLGLAMMNIGRNTESFAAIGDGRRLSPYDPMAFAMIGCQGINLAKLGRFDEAADYLDRGNALPNAHHNMRAAAAIVHARLGNDRKTSHYLRELWSSSPTFDTQSFTRAFPDQSREDIVFVDSVLKRFRAALT